MYYYIYIYISVISYTETVISGTLALFREKGGFGYIKPGKWVSVYETYIFA